MERIQAIAQNVSDIAIKVDQILRNSLLNGKGECPWGSPGSKHTSNHEKFGKNAGNGCWSEAGFLGILMPARGTSGDKSEWLSGMDARELNAKLKVRSSASTSTWVEKFGGLDPNSQGLGFSTSRDILIPLQHCWEGSWALQMFLHMAAWSLGFRQKFLPLPLAPHAFQLWAKEGLEEGWWLLLTQPQREKRSCCLFSHFMAYSGTHPGG